MLTIKSSNPNLSFILSKHPDNVSERKVRTGKIAGFYSDGVYHTVYKDAPNKAGFVMDNSGSMLDVSESCAPYMYNSIVIRSLKDALNRKNDLDVTGFKHEINMTCVYVENLRDLETIERAFEDVAGISLSVTQREMLPVNYKEIIIKADGVMLCHALKALMVITVLLTGKSQLSNTKITDDFISNYSIWLDELQLGYAIRYMFGKRILVGDTQFNKFKELIGTPDMELNFGNSQYHRWVSIRDRICKTSPLIDFGCGEGEMTLRLSTKGFAPSIYVHDEVEENVDMVQAKANARGLTVNSAYTTDELIDLYCENEGISPTLLISEVVEHNPKDKALEIVSDLLNKLAPDMAYITVPNREFNKHYLMDEGELRHSDHDWEPTKDEFEDFIQSTLVNQEVEYNVEFINIGDSVGGVSSTIGAIVTKKTIKPKAYITVGCSASGKSTWARKLVESGPQASTTTLDERERLPAGAYVEVNADVIRFDGFHKDWDNYQFNNSNESKVWRRHGHRVDSLSERGVNMVISDTNLNVERREALGQKLLDRGYQVSFQHMWENFEEIVKRHDKQRDAIPYESVLHQWVRHTRQLLGIEKYVPEIKEDGYIFDCDGTLFDISHRDPFDYDKMHLDKPRDEVFIALIGALALNKPIVILSGRKHKYAQQTMDMVNQYLLNVGFDSNAISTIEFIFRKDECDDKDYLVKYSSFEHICNDYGKLDWKVYDDRPQVIEQCWNILGLTVIDCKNKTYERF